MSDFYTKEELELFGGTAPSDEPFQHPQSAQGVDMLGQQPVQQNMPYEQNVQLQQMENAPQFIKDIQDPGSKTYRNIRMGVSIAGAVKLIIFGLIFSLVPLTGFIGTFSSLKEDGAGVVEIFPILMVLLFGTVGISVLVKGIRELIRSLKNK